MSIQEPPVAVTGVSGFIASHVAAQLLHAGSAVRGSVRDATATAPLRMALAQPDPARLQFVTADLERDAGWQELLHGTRLLVHVASPFPEGAPRNEQDLIRPAVEGTLRVLRAAHRAGVQRVVLTSSIAAVMMGQARDGSRRYGENDWSDVASVHTSAYAKSKTLAEQAAWEFVQSLPEGQRFEMVTINPGVVLGPLVTARCGTSNQIVKALLGREVPAAPDVGFAFADVRDVAALHLRALVSPEAAGKRFCCAGEHTPIVQLARLLAAQGYGVPTRRLPNWILRGAALFDPGVALLVPELGKRSDIDSSLAERLLAWKPRPIELTLADTARSLIEHQIVRAKRRSAAVAPA